MHRRLFLASLPVAAGAQIAPAIPPLRGLSRTNLLEYRGAGGNVRIARNSKEWEVRKQEALAAMHQITGPLPGSEKRVPLQVTVEDETDMGSYVRRAISYTSEPRSRTTAYLCIPKSALAGKKAPAVLCLHPTDNVAGYKVVVGLGGRPHRQYAAELAERGFVTISPSYVQLAQYQPDLNDLGYASGTMKGIWDNVRAMDLLDALSAVRKGRYGVIGHSLGGHNAIYTAVHDARIAVIVSSCGFDSFLDYYGGNIKGWVQPRYMMRMEKYLGQPQNVPFDFYELLAVLAPRPVFVNAPMKDANFHWDSVDRIANAARSVYALYGATDNVRVAHPQSDHDFPDAERAEAYKWIEKALMQA
jgi:dienelactone hydrolase